MLLKVSPYLVSLLLVACQQATVETTTITVPEVKYLTLPEYFLKHCEYPLPPQKEEYNKKNFIEREEVLVGLYLEGAKSIHLCNQRLDQAKAYQEKMKVIYKEVKHDDHERTP